MSKVFTISIIDDGIAECDETFKLKISVPSSQSTCGVIVNETELTEVTIRDNDSRRSVCCITYILINLQEQHCLSTNHNILLKRILLHYQLV